MLYPRDSSNSSFDKEVSFTLNTYPTISLEEKDTSTLKPASIFLLPL